MRTTRERIVAAALAVAAFGCAADLSAADSGVGRALIPVPLGVFGPNGGIAVGSTPGREVEAGVCFDQGKSGYGSHNFQYDSVYASPSAPTVVGTSNAYGTQACGSFIGPPGVPGIGNPGGANTGYSKISEPTGTALGSGGGVVVGGSKGQEIEVGICNRNATGPLPAGYSYDYVNTSTSTPGSGQQPNCDGDPPAAVTLMASDVTATTATLVGRINPNRVATRWHFEAGTSTSYSAISTSVRAGDGGQDQTVYLGVSNLTPGTTYHYRVVAESAAGTTYGDDMSFTAPAS